MQHARRSTLSGKVRFLYLDSGAICFCFLPIITAAISPGTNKNVPNGRYPTLLEVGSQDSGGSPTPPSQIQIVCSRRMFSNPYIWPDATNRIIESNMTRKGLGYRQGMYKWTSIRTKFKLIHLMRYTFRSRTSYSASFDSSR